MANPDKPRNRPTVPQVAPLAEAVYRRHIAGCCAHLVLDDGNAEQHSADYCLDYARRQGHADCIALCEALVQMTPTQRRTLYHRRSYWEMTWQGAEYRYCLFSLKCV